jgi:hypothetical protein
LHESFKPEEIVETSNGFSQPSAKKFVCGGKSRNDFNINQYRWKLVLLNPDTDEVVMEQL